jgi:hypothetical protein
MLLSFWKIKICLFQDNILYAEIPAFEFKLAANKSYGSTGGGTVSDR